MSVPQCFIDRVDVGHPLSCWEWTGSIAGGGYGSLWLDGRTQSAHRVAYEIFNGPIPDGLHLDHLCRNQTCVNPDHLETVTHHENNRRGYGITAKNILKAACIRGHPFDDINTYWHRGRRRCKECRRAATRRWWRRRTQVAAA